MFKIINMHLSKKVALTTDGSYIKKVAQKVQELAVSKVSNCQRAISIQNYLPAGYRLPGYKIITKGVFKLDIDCQVIKL